MKHYYNQIKLSPDDSAGGATEADPLNTPCGDIDVSRPIAKAANYEMTIVEATVAEKNGDATRHNVVIKLKSTKEAKSTKGDVMHAGALVLKAYYPTKETEKMTRKEVGQKFAKLVKGVGLPAAVTPGDVINNPSVLVGKIGIFKVGIKAETSEFPEGNEIKDVVVPE